MDDIQMLDPYADNILCQNLGPIYSRAQSLGKLIECPVRPGQPKEIPPHIRLRHMMRLRDFHIPRAEGARLFESIDLLVREGYRYRDPTYPGTFATISGEAMRHKRSRMPTLAAAVGGVSGGGKTEACLRSLNCYPHQVITHATFPGLVGPHQQVVWLSLDVPPSGKANDLARALMGAWAHATGSSRFASLLAKEKFKNPMQALDEWRQVAASHFLGILHLDEIQNFFKISTLEQRRKRKIGDGPPELSIVEDECLRWILTLCNTWGIPLLLSGTPDGIGALSRRLSITERMATGGYHEFQPFGTWNDPQFQKNFLSALGHYQYVNKRIAVNDGLAELIFTLSGGVPRIIVLLWIAAHRIALEDPADTLTPSHFVKAAETLLAPLGPAISALRSQDPLRLAKYEDLISSDPTIWLRFWEDFERI